MGDVVIGGASADTVSDPRRTAISATSREAVWLVLAAILLTANSIDAVWEIPPLADDYWMIASEPGEIAREYFHDYGWGRFIGIWLVDLTNAVRALTGAPLVVVLLVMRVLVLAAVYFTLRRLFAFAAGTSLLAVALIAWNPPAAEGWVLLCNVHLAASAIPVLAACGLFARALGVVPVTGATAIPVENGSTVGWRWAAWAAAAQIVANFVYEQALLAVPAFVLVLMLFGPGSKPPVRARIGVLAVTGASAVASAVVMLASGYIGSRTAASSAPAEHTDLSSALGALWIGFGEHHLWRVIEAVRTQRLFWWDRSPLGVAAAAATLAACFAVAQRLVRDRSSASSTMGVSMALAALAAAYAALVPTGLAYPGYTIFSRLYYVPGAFLALAVASLVQIPSRIPRVAVGLAAGAAMLWLGIVTRRYYDDMRQGTRILRVVARSIARVPPAVRQGGLLVVAQSNVGTFSTSAVEPWSLRPAVRELTGVNPEGPLLLTTDCAELRREPPRINQESVRARPVAKSETPQTARWAAVLRYDAGGVQIAPSIAVACAQ
jgi:hypothetical protein